MLRNLDRQIFEVVVFAQDTPQVPSVAAILAAADRVVFFPGHEGVASIGESVQAGGRKTVSLKMPNLHLSREVVQAEQVGILFARGRREANCRYIVSKHVGIVTCDLYFLCCSLCGGPFTWKRKQMYDPVNILRR